MELRKEMFKPDSNKVPIISQDAASYFSEEEWKLLHEWQKELYRNVMLEIHQALISLGPLIVTTVSTLRAKDKDVCCMDQEDNEARQNMYHSSRFVSLDSDDVLSMDQVSEAYLKENPNSAGDISADPVSGSEASLKIISLKIKEEEEFYPVFHQEYEGRENIHCPAGFPLHNTESVITCLDDHETEGEQSRSSVDKDHTFTRPMVSFCIKEEEEDCFIDHRSTEREFISSRRGKGSMRRKRNRDTQKRIEKIPTCKISLRKPRPRLNLCQSSENGPNSMNPLWPENYQELQGETTYIYASDLNKELQPSVHHGTHKPGRSHMYNECEDILLNAELVSWPQETLHTWQQDECTELEHNLAGKGPLQLQRSDARKRPFQCTKCKKSFIQKRHLNRHQNIHTGERPYHCTECGKSFIQKQHFIGHQRKHTGERPYQCNECDKSYTLKQCLIIHQRKHARQE